MNRKINSTLAFLFLILGSISYAQENTALTCADGIDNDTLIDCDEPE